MYALVVLHTKTLATSSGPLWVYGTSSLGHRKMRERVSDVYSLIWLKLFASLGVLHSSWLVSVKWISVSLDHSINYIFVEQVFVKLLIFSSFAAGFWIIFSQDVDLRSIVKFAPNGFRTQIAQFSFDYTQSQYRMSVCLVGILVRSKKNWIPFRGDP